MPRLQCDQRQQAQAHTDRCRRRVEECLKVTPHGAERLDRIIEVINEALAEEVQRGEQRKKRRDNQNRENLRLNQIQKGACS